MAQNPATMQKLAVLNGHGEKLVGILHDTGSTEVVVLCHGFRSSKETSTISNLAVALGNEGISAFRFDFAGNGESEGLFQYGNYSREAEDLRSVIEYLNGAKHRVIAILGHSKGGNVVLLYACKYHDIHAVVNVSGRYDLKRGIEGSLGKDFMERITKDGFIDVKKSTGNHFKKQMKKSAGEVDYRVIKESLMDRLNTNMHDACLSIDERCRVLTIHGSNDKIIPAEDALAFDKIIPNHKLHIIEGANHGYTSHQAELASVVVPFVKECLQLDKDAPK